jgi:hypothetical protein
MATIAEKTARTQAGDGKLPNRYWVVAGNGWLREIEKSTFDGVEGSKPKKALTQGPFNTYREAEVVADKLINELESPDINENGWNTVTIEDRLNGQCFEATYYEQRDFCVCGRATTRSIELEWHKESWAGKKD